jgi:hypothetical protein
VIRAAVMMAACVALLAAPARGIELRAEGDRLFVTGDIDPDDDFVLLSALVAQRATVQVVHFHEMPGGDATAALRMGRIIRARGLDTIATSICMSACAFAFLGGVNRRLAVDTASRSAVLALHGPVDSHDPNATLPQDVVDLIVGYIGEMTGGRADPPMVERIMALKLYNFVYFVAVLPASGRGAAQTGTLECRSNRLPADADDVRRDCQVITGTGAFELGFVSTNFVYRMAPGTPYRRP